MHPVDSADEPCPYAPVIAVRSGGLQTMNILFFGQFVFLCNDIGRIPSPNLVRQRFALRRWTFRDNVCKKISRGMRSNATARFQQPEQPQEFPPDRPLKRAGLGCGLAAPVTRGGRPVCCVSNWPRTGWAGAPVEFLRRALW